MTGLDRDKLEASNALMLRALTALSGNNYRSQQVAQLEVELQQLLIENNSLRANVDFELL